MRIGRRSDFSADCKRILLSFSLVRICVNNTVVDDDSYESTGMHKNGKQRIFAVTFKFM